MAEISKITLPSGNTYEIKDATAREMISGGISFIVAWDGTAAPVVANVPKGVVIIYNSTTYTGTMEASAAQAGAFYLVKSSTQVGVKDIYDEYVVADIGGTKEWEKLGDTQVDLSDVVMGVELNKQTDVALGEATTFTMNQPSISVTPSTTYLGASASGTAVGANGTASAITGFGEHSTSEFVTSVSADMTKKLVTTSIPNVTGNTNVTVPNITANTSVTANKSTWSFTMGTGTNAETLVIGGGNGSDVTATNTTLGTAATASKVTLGTAITAATGAVATTGTGAAVATDVTVGDTASAITSLGTPTKATVLTGVRVTSEPTIALASNSSTATGRVQVATGISSASASGGSITVGTNDKVTTLTNGTSITVTKGS